jgi:L-fuculose-phosphate aldolase
MKKKAVDAISNLIDFGGKAAIKKLIWASSGNISYRLGKGAFIISGSGTHIENLKENDFVILDMENRVLEGEGKPSIETKMHSAIYKAKSEVMTVFHSQAFFTTLLSCTDLFVNSTLFPESMAYMDCVLRVSYNHPGSQELADEVSDKISQCDILVLNNHGAICAGPSLSDVLLKTETLEMLCKMIIFAKVTELNLNFLPEKLKEDFLSHLKELKKKM